MRRVGVLLVVLYLALSSFVGRAFALENVRLAPVVEAAASSVEYNLPFPGMLPDSPFYFLKVVRDQIVTGLISDQTRKSFYLLLLSDKRLGAGQSLINSGKEVLGVNTLLKSEEYFSRAVGLLVEEKAAGKNVEDLAAKLTVAGAKHGEILGIAAGEVSEKESFSVLKARQSNADSRKRIMELLLQRRG